MIPTLFQDLKAGDAQLAEIIALLREIRDLLKPKPLGRPKKHE